MIELLGEDATLKLVEAYGGTRRGVPKKMPKEHELLDLLGPSSFALLHQYFAGSEIAIPLARQWRVHVFERKGLTPKELALRAGMSERHVHRILREKRAMSGQMSLFDAD
jgi:AraC-like DNA-binding protein